MIGSDWINEVQENIASVIAQNMTPNPPPNPQVGELWYDSNDRSAWVWSGGMWLRLGPSVYETVGTEWKSSGGLSSEA